MSCQWADEPGHDPGRCRTCQGDNLSVIARDLPDDIRWAAEFIRRELPASPKSWERADRLEAGASAVERLQGAVDLLKIAVGCERFETCGGPTGQPICAPCIQFARAHIPGWGQ